MADMLYTSKERIFHVEFNYMTKKYDLMVKNWKNFNFSIFFVKNKGDQVSSMANFSNFFITYFKNDFATSCQKVWT